MAGGNSGMATAVALLGGAGDLGLGGEEQPELFADADDAPAPFTPSRSGPRGGRPKGARNRSTEEMRRYLASRYQSPLIGCAETWSRSPEDLARELFPTREVNVLAPGQQAISETPIYNAEGALRGTRYLVWDLDRANAIQREAQAAALPYWHQKLPMAVEVSAPTRGLVILGDLGGEDGAENDLALPLPPETEIQRNQDVSEAELVKSDGQQSDDAPNALEYRDE